jgi:hypothetical protein
VRCSSAPVDRGKGCHVRCDTYALDASCDRIIASYQLSGSGCARIE